MIRRKDLVNSLDESGMGRVRFNDGSGVDTCGEGSILVKCAKREDLELRRSFTHINIM